MRARYFSGYVLLLLAACNPTDKAVFGPGLPPQDEQGGSATDGGSDSAKSGAANVAGSGGKPAHAGAASGGAPSAGTPAIGGGGNATAGTGNPPEPPQAGADSGGAAGEPGMPPQPDCGNGVIEAGEQCDGGDATEADGCSDDCKVVCAEHDKDAVESADHHCYFGYDQANFADSREACVNRGAHLVTIGSAAENELVAQLVKVSKFLGAFEDVPAMSEGTGEYSWITGEALTYTNWAAEEPNHAAARCVQTGPGPGPIAKNCYEHCVAMVSEGKWADQLCERVDGYVCEWEPPGTK